MTAPARRHLAALDGLRGAAAVMVVVYHCCDANSVTSFGGGTIRLLISAGMLGVDFFFILSGFLLFLPVARDGTLGDPRRYAIRRVARVVPAYYASLLVLVLLHPLFRQGAWPLASQAGVATFFAHLSFLQLEAAPVIAWAFPATTRTGFEVNGVWWTLSLEALFYAALPLVASRYRRHPLVGLALALAISIGWRAALFHQQAIAGLLGFPPEAWPRETSDRWLLALTPQLPGYAGDFALGMTGAWLFTWLDARRDRVRIACGAALVLLVPLLLVAMRHTGAIWLLHLPRTSLGFYAPALAPAVLFAASIVLLPLAPAPLQWPLTNQLARWVGDVSYGVYLSHELVIAALATHAGLRSDVGAPTSLRLLALVLPAALAIGALSRRVLEAPLMAAAGSAATRPVYVDAPTTSRWPALVGAMVGGVLRRRSRHRPRRRSHRDDDA